LSDSGSCFFFKEDVDQAESILSNEFIVDAQASVDKRIHKFNEFGYMSLHLILSINEARQDLKEYSSLIGLRFEIQIRTILQHSWAEIEHDLGYKNGAGLPDEIRRSFARLAGTFELADEEFSRIRTSVSRFNSESLPIETVADVGITPKSIIDYINQNQIVNDCFEEILASTAVEPLREVTYLQASSVLERLKFIGVDTISEIDSLLAMYRQYVVKLAKSILGTSKRGIMASKRIVLFYLVIFVLLNAFCRSTFQLYSRSFDIPRKIQKRLVLKFDEFEIS